jgi:hypothetical protein
VSATREYVFEELSTRYAEGSNQRTGKYTLDNHKWVLQVLLTWNGVQLGHVSLSERSVVDVK